MNENRPEIQFIKKLVVVCSIVMIVALLIGLIVRSSSSKPGTTKPKSDLPYVIDKTR